MLKNRSLCLLLLFLLAVNSSVVSHASDEILEYQETENDVPDADALSLPETSSILHPKLPETPVYTPCQSEDEEYESQLRMAAALPSSYRSENQNLITPVKDQNPFGTCWAFSAISACESSMIKRGLYDHSLDLSEFHFAYFFYHTQADPLNYTTGDKNLLSYGNYLNSGGNDIFSMFALAKWTGAASEALAPYPSANAPKLSASLAYQDMGHLQNARYVSCLDRASIKRLIMEYGSVSVPIYMAPSIYLNETTGAYYCRENVTTNHQVVLTGWDDSYSRNSFSPSCRPSGNGAWIAKNSYGTGFGDEGYIYISYEDMSMHSADCRAFAYDMEAPDNYSHNYQYDGSASPTSRRFSSGGSIANIFTVKGNPGGRERLDAVSFALASDNVQYAIQIYKNPTSDDPTSGIPVFDRAQSGVTSYCGYYTIDLQEKVIFNQGDRFSVVISFASVNGRSVYFFTDETEQVANLRFVSSGAAEQSYYRTIGSSYWKDLNYGLGANNRIKAFTTDTSEPATKVLPNISSLSRPFIERLQNKSCTQMYVSWLPVTFATEYRIYRSTSKKGPYKQIASTKGTSWTDSNLTAGKKYYYRIKAFTDSRYYGKVESPYSTIQSKKLLPPKVSFISLSKKGKTKAYLSWKKISDATGYEIYRKLSGKNWKKVKTIKKSAIVKYKTGGRKGTTCQYKIRAYKKVNKKRICGSFSRTRKIKF